MKKLLVLTMVLVTCSMANATLQISVNGIVDVPDTEIVLAQSEYVTLDVMGDGQNEGPTPYLIVIGPGSIAGHTMLYPGTATSYAEIEAKAAEAEMSVPDYIADRISLWAGYGYDATGMTDLSYMEFVDFTVPPAPTMGKLLDDVIFHCEGPGDVKLALIGYGVDEFGNDIVVEYDSQIIHQIPEPMTIALLGLGGLFLRRRK